jgi:hypothetical protein
LDFKINYLTLFSKKDIEVHRATGYERTIGEVAERLKAPLSKSGILPKAGSWVRIPPSPPFGKHNKKDQVSAFLFYSESQKAIKGLR